MFGIYDDPGMDISETEFRTGYIKKRISELRKGLEGSDAVQLSRYKRDHAPQGGFLDWFSYLNDPERQARVCAAQSLLEEHFPGMSRGFDPLFLDAIFKG